MINQNSLVSIPLEVYCILNILCILLNPGCTEIQEILKLIQVEKSGMAQDVSSCEGVESSTENITLLLKENVDKLVKKLK